jgi:hypothetical protein
MTTTPDSTSATTVGGERADLLEPLSKARFFLRLTTRTMTDEQARMRPTVSQLTLGGIIKHVADAEERWTRFMLGQPGGPQGVDPDGPAAEVIAEWEASMQMQPGETLAGLLDRYADVAAVTDAAIASLPDLDASLPLPPAPWFEPGAHWSARRVLLHIIAETAQHAGHADIIRESIDGAKSMG